MRQRTVAVVLCALVARGGIAQAPARLQLVRCAATSDAPCVRTRVMVPPAARVAAGQLDSAAGAWSGTLGASRLTGPGLAARSVVLPARLLVLIDRGPAMAGEGIAFTRIALQSWLATLDTGAVRVAVVGFDGRGLDALVARAAFVPPGASAALLDTLPPPGAKGHSPLYSAAAVGARRLAAVRDSAPGTIGDVLIFTAGHNDVGRGVDAAAFLAGAAGLREASAAVAASGQRIWILALSATPPIDELRTLAGPGGTVATVALDPNAIAGRLAAFSRELIGARDVTFGSETIGAGALGRVAAVGAVRMQLGDTQVSVATLAWRPPLIALPTFQGVADPTTLSPALQEALVLAGGGSSRPLVALVMIVVVGMAWFLGLHLGWREPAPPTPAPRDRATATRAGMTESAAQAAPPRKPEDITHQTARRTALRR